MGEWGELFEKAGAFAALFLILFSFVIWLVKYIIKKSERDIKAILEMHQKSNEMYERNNEMYGKSMTLIADKVVINSLELTKLRKTLRTYIRSNNNHAQNKQP